MYTHAIVTIFEDDEDYRDIRHLDTVAKRISRLATPEDYGDEDLYVKMSKKFYVCH